ncbi:MAG: AAA family ATPase [Thermoguttaceae bacterium]|nr:AAA family ATPase [Thermoguttaceae bacterium]
MLTRLRVRNFKRLEMDVELTRSVVFIGPNNSGKTTALQALTLWELGLRQWLAKRGGKAVAGKRPGVAINRRDLISIPVPSANLLWRDLHVRSVKSTNGKTESTRNIRIDVIVDGVSDGHNWSCGLEFDYTNEESFVCRPIRQEGFDETPVQAAKFTSIPDAAAAVKVAYLPPMSGLAATEPKWEPGRVNVLLGEGQTAQVLRNLCYFIYEKENDHATWEKLRQHIQSLFGVSLMPPQHVAERGEITMEYEEPNGVRLDLSASGRGLQQTLLLLAHLYANPKTVLLLDEPDAHLEILRQRQIYQILTETAEQQGAQVIAASHSEVVLNEAAARGQVIAFVGRPHALTDRGSQVLKALTDIGFDQYYQAEQTGWVLYLEDATDLAILREFARLLDHRAKQYLERPFVSYVATNLPQRARDHFFGLREAKQDLVGIAIFDRLDKELQRNTPLLELMWSRREIENYFCSEQVLMGFARGEQPNDLFSLADRERREQAMRESIQAVSAALRTLGKPDPWSADIKASDDFLDPLFRDFSARLDLPLVLRKSQYWTLVKFAARDAVDPEVSRMLDAIVQVADKAKAGER